MWSLSYDSQQEAEVSQHKNAMCELIFPRFEKCWYKLLQSVTRSVNNSD
jgi:hypothetical protein